MDSYQKEFSRNQLTVPDEDKLRAYFKKKYPHLSQKTKGQFNILAIFHHYNWEKSALLPSLEKFGTVNHYDWLSALGEIPKKWRKKDKDKISQDLMDHATHHAAPHKIDAIFTYLSGEQVYPETIKHLAALNIPTVNMCLNDKEAFVGKIISGQASGSRDICRYFDLSWTSTIDALKKYCLEGARPIYLPEGANPDLHKAHDNLERTIDVSFVGQCYGNRQAVIEKLRAQGINVVAYGAGWPNGPLSTEEMIKLYSKSKINLGFGGVDGLTGAYCLKGRDFEVTMSGGLYLTEYNPELCKVYNLKSEICTYNNIGELSATISTLLNNPGKADSIRQNGCRRAHNDHSWETRFGKIFSIMGLLKD